MNALAAAPVLNAPTGFDAARYRRDFPILRQRVNGKPLAYLDNAATAQKPVAVIEALDRYYRDCNANIHRGAHRLSERATAAYESAREKIRRYLNADSVAEIIFTRGATEGINLVAQTWGRRNLKRGDEIVISEMEHHSNIVPWQMLREETGATLKVIPINDAGEIVMEEYERLLKGRVRLVAVAHISNALGTVNPIRAMIEKAQAVGALTLIDGAQSMPHTRVDMRALGCDFFVFSGHKMFAPTGIGVLYGRQALLEAMPPYQGGGDMIKMVSFKKTLYNNPPYKFEAGTPNIAGAIGLGAAVDYLEQMDFDALAAYERELLDYAAAAASQVPGLRLIGAARDKAGVLSFVLQGAHAHDVGTVLDSEGVAIRAGHHCAMPVMERFKVAATGRASFAFYNTRAEVDALIAGIEKAKRIFHC